MLGHAILRLSASCSLTYALGDEVVFHDQLFAHGQHAGDDVGDCVIVDLTPELPNNCSAVFRLPGGNITTQFSSSPGPASSPLR